MLSSPELAHEYKNKVVEDKIIKQVYSKLLEGTEKCLNLQYHVDLSFVDMLSEKYPACEFKQSLDENWICVRLKPCPITEKKKLPVQISKETTVQEKKEQSNESPKTFSLDALSRKHPAFSFGLAPTSVSPSVSFSRPINTTAPVSTFGYGNAISSSFCRNTTSNEFGSYPGNTTFAGSCGNPTFGSKNATSHVVKDIPIQEKKKKLNDTSVVSSGGNFSLSVTKDVPIQEKKEQSNVFATNSPIGNEDVAVVNTQ